MALRTFVKISSVNNLSDARYCAGMYVNVMGFALEQNDSNYISPQKFKVLSDWVSGVEFVAEFKNSHPENILTTLQDYEGFTFIQIEEEAHLQMLLNTNYGLIWKVELEKIERLDEVIMMAESLKDGGIVVLLEGDLSLDQSVKAKINELSSKCDVLVGFDITAENVNELLEETQIKGIALKGGDEIKPGIKDFDELADILETLEVED
ncbi:phosphoribosylanthranilate isomerase [Litoribacter alkaliphilus]|uniref:Phosphoribosylanthranilate isomerase n=1 Tax=Litoribacter ruber TaxID=702568 RepID=A0AAP2CJ08_9BACT|nr:phosphoribosylanthranilate isomerase [Litoribacter alkaliphilus]MBS9524589.1 phosphoribosylanthranilate isomerase [Litoribacter alkaliphilus]